MNVSPLRNAEGFSTVADWMNNGIDLDSLVDGKEYGMFTTAEDWRKIVKAVKNDPDLMNLRIVETHVDNAKGGGGGQSAIFVDDKSKEATVVFRGTSTDEWKDNFTGGNVTDTDQQKNALEWYQKAYREHGLDQYEVTVTGHSKGGNKSKYITVKDDTVDRCVSFDGQGFSDKFMDEYSDRIAARQERIENHNVDYDYVNLLLNDIGETTYYKGKDIDHNFLENHCANSYFDWDEDGTFSMEESPEGQPAEMKAVDEFLNSSLRSLPDQDRDQMLSVIHKFVMLGFSAGDIDADTMWNDFRNIMHDPETAESLPYLLAYFIQYERSNPEMAEHIRNFMRRNGYDHLLNIVNVAEGILNFELDIDLPFGKNIHIDFDDLMSIISGTGLLLGKADWILDKVRKWIREKYGLDVSREDLRLFLTMIDRVDRDMETIHIVNNGSDIKIQPQHVSKKSEPVSGGAFHQFKVELEKIRRAGSEMNSVAADLKTYAGIAGRTPKSISFSTGNAASIRASLFREAQKLEKLERIMEKFSCSVTDILLLYETTEKRLKG